MLDPAEPTDRITPSSVGLLAAEDHVSAVFAVEAAVVSASIESDPCLRPCIQSVEHEDESERITVVSHFILFPPRSHLRCTP